MVFASNHLSYQEKSYIELLRVFAIFHLSVVGFHYLLLHICLAYGRLNIFLFVRLPFLLFAVDYKTHCRTVQLFLILLIYRFLFSISIPQLSLSYCSFVYLSLVYNTRIRLQKFARVYLSRIDSFNA